MRACRADIHAVPARRKTVMTLGIAVAAVLVFAGVRFVAGAHSYSGPIVISLSATHGVHANDGVTLALWLAAARTLRWSYLRTRATAVRP